MSIDFQITFFNGHFHNRNKVCHVIMETVCVLQMRVHIIEVDRIEILPDEGMRTETVN